MAAVLDWAGTDDEPVPSSFPSSQHRVRGRRTAVRPGELPPDIAAAVWRGDELGSAVSTVASSGFPALDAELPGGGWPCHALTEVLQPQATVAEWRLLAPTMREVVARGQPVVVIGPPKSPHLPGLRLMGLDERQLVWIQAEAPAERLWVTEQVIKANASGVLVAWLPQARPEQIRRLQICAQVCDGPVFLCRPAAAEHEPSAAPLRLQLRLALDWELQVRLLKRRGPVHDGVITLPSVPGGLDAILTPRLRRPSALWAARDGADTTSSPAPLFVTPMLGTALLPERLPIDELRRIEATSGLSSWCLQFTPRVAVIEPLSSSPAVVMDVEASVRLFGSKRRLVERVP